VTAGKPAGRDSFASGARILSIGIASTGLFTFAYLATASHMLGAGSQAYSRISLCWSVMFVILSVIYRPIEQLLSRTIADQHARHTRGHILRTPALLQVSFALLFLVLALVLRDPIEHGLFDDSVALYWILVVGVLAYAGSYFARGWLAGNRRFALYGALVFLESTSRFVFALAVVVGITSGQNAIAVGMAVAPFVSLCVIPFAFRRMRSVPVAANVDTLAVEAGDAAAEGTMAVATIEEQSDLSLRNGGRFAISVVAIMLAEQALMNAGVIVVAANSHFKLTLGITGFVFNVLLIVRAPLQLFQAVQTSILPHLTGMAADDDRDQFSRTIRLTVLVIGAFAGAVALGLLVIGPPVMKALVGTKGGFSYNRYGLTLVGIGMGLHLTSGTFNQALLARGRAPLSAIAWLLAAGAFVAFVATDTIANEVTRVEVGYCGAAGLLAAMLWVLYRATAGSSATLRQAEGEPAAAGQAAATIA
jgi:O-antigen/teichoic acid export membrane protein